MRNTTYLIVGGGMTAAAAVEGIRERDAEGAIVLVGSEAHPPYKRPPLSKKLWQSGDEAPIWYDSAPEGAEYVTGRRIVELDLDARRARDDRGDEYGYEKLLLATGGTPRRLGGQDDEVVYFRTIDDFRRLRAAARRLRPVACLQYPRRWPDRPPSWTDAPCRVRPRRAA